MVAIELDTEDELDDVLLLLVKLELAALLTAAAAAAAAAAAFKDFAVAKDWAALA